MFILICVASVFCCYLNYTFDATVSRNVFYIFLIAFGADLLLVRIYLIFMYSLIRTLLFSCKGYKQIKTTNSQIKKDVNKAIYNLFHHEPTKGGNSTTTKGGSASKTKGGMRGSDTDLMDYDYHTG